MRAPNALVHPPDRRARRALALLLAAALSGCATAPPPAPGLAQLAPPQWYAPAPHGGTASQLADWWQQPGSDTTLAALVQAALADADDELQRARAVWQGKFGARAETPDAAERARQMRFLMSRGFSGETIRRVLRGDFEDD